MHCGDTEQQAKEAQKVLKTNVNNIENLYQLRFGMCITIAHSEKVHNTFCIGH